jgi:flagellin
MSSSILTNTGAMIALQSLEATNNALNNVQNQVSTGLAVNTAKDNAATWVVSTTMNANIASLQQVGTNLGNADSVLSTAVSGATQVSSLISQIRAAVVSTQDPSTDVAATQNQVDQLVNQINAIATSSSFNGVNLLDGTNPTGISFLASTANNYLATNAASTTISSGNGANLTMADTAATGTTLDATMKALYDLVDSAGTGGGLSAITSATLDANLKTIDTANQTVENAAAQFGAVQSNVDGQQTFVNSLVTTLQTGVGNMVDANMTAESAKLSALQVQQQLGTQALSIANQAPQMLLKLFGG